MARRATAGWASRDSEPEMSQIAGKVAHRMAGGLGLPTAPDSAFGAGIGELARVPVDIQRRFHAISRRTRRELSAVEESSGHGFGEI